MSAADDMMRDKHGKPPRSSRPAAQPMNLLPVRAAVAAWREGRRRGLKADDNVNLASYAAEVLPQLCDEIVRLRAQVAGVPVVPF